MKREEIEQQISGLNIARTEAELQQLTDLFIELSNERCKEQRELCADTFNECQQDDYMSQTLAIVSSLLPEIK